jgi:hypothetical protein
VVMCPTSHLESESQKRANQPSHATREHTLEKQQQTSYPSKQSHPQEISFSVVDLALMQANMILSEQYLLRTTLHALPYADDAATFLPQRHTPPIDAKFWQLKRRSCVLRLEVERPCLLYDSFLLQLRMEELLLGNLLVDYKTNRII